MAGQPHFHAVTNLDEIVAKMIAPSQRKIAKRVEHHAKRGAPPTKKWRHIGDGAVRKQHRQMHGEEVPTNIRFRLNAYQWDADHPGRVAPGFVGRKSGEAYDRDAPMAEGQHSYLLYPRDTTSGAYVATVSCFPADTPVQVIGKLKAAIRAPYEGPMVTVRMASGGVLTGTPNHPVVTDRGWVALGCVNVGDHLVRAGVGEVHLTRSAGDPVVHPYVQDAPARIGEVYETLSQRHASHRVRAGVVDFYGDRPAGEVDVVPVDGLLGHGRDAASEEHPLDLDLPEAPEGVRGRGAPRGALLALLIGARLTAHGIVRRGRPLLALFRRGSGVAGDECLAAVTQRDAGVAQERDDRGARDGQRFGDGDDGLAGFVAADHLVTGEVGSPVGVLVGGGAELDAAAGQGPSQGARADADLPGEGGGRLSFEVAAFDLVEEVRIEEEWRGHVFTLSTSTDIYAAGGYVVRNCRCTVEINPSGIRKLIEVKPTLVVGRKVTTKVVAEGAWVVEAERGDIYPGAVPSASGTYFMKHAVAATAGWLNRATKAR